MESTEAVHPGAGLPLLHKDPVGDPHIFPGEQVLQLFGSEVAFSKSLQSAAEFPPHSTEQVFYCAKADEIKINVIKQITFIN